MRSIGQYVRSSYQGTGELYSTVQLLAHYQSSATQNVHTEVVLMVVDAKLYLFHVLPTKHENDVTRSEISESGGTRMNGAGAGSVAVQVFNFG